MAAGEDARREILQLMHDVLGERFVRLEVRRVVSEQDFETGSTAVTCEVQDSTTDENSVIAGKGVGLVDAFFQGFVDRFAGAYPSLKTVRFTSFTIGANMETKDAFAGTDSQGEVTVEVMNSEGAIFRFRHASRSIIASTIITTLRALEYFVNSELAYVTLYEARRDAVQRNRTDLIEHYTHQMALLVRNTSYSEVIERLKAGGG